MSAFYFTINDETIEPNLHTIAQRRKDGDIILHIDFIFSSNVFRTKMNQLDTTKMGYFQVPDALYQLGFEKFKSGVRDIDIFFVEFKWTYQCVLFGTIEPDIILDTTHPDFIIFNGTPLENERMLSQQVRLPTYSMNPLEMDYSSLITEDEKIAIQSRNIPEYILAPTGTRTVTQNIRFLDVREYTPLHGQSLALKGSKFISGTRWMIAYYQNVSLQTYEYVAIIVSPLHNANALTFIPLSIFPTELLFSEFNYQISTDTFYASSPTADQNKGVLYKINNWSQNVPPILNEFLVDIETTGKTILNVLDGHIVISSTVNISNATRNGFPLGNVYQATLPGVTQLTNLGNVFIQEGLQANIQLLENEPENYALISSSFEVTQQTLHSLKHQSRTLNVSGNVHLNALYVDHMEFNSTHLLKDIPQQVTITEYDTEITKVHSSELTLSIETTNQVNVSTSITANDESNVLSVPHIPNWIHRVDERWDIASKLYNINGIWIGYDVSSQHATGNIFISNKLGYEQNKIDNIYVDTVLTQSLQTDTVLLGGQVVQHYPYHFLSSQITVGNIVLNEYNPNISIEIENQLTLTKGLQIPPSSIQQGNISFNGISKEAYVHHLTNQYNEPYFQYNERDEMHYDILLKTFTTISSFNNIQRSEFSLFSTEISEQYTQSVSNQYALKRTTLDLVTDTNVGFLVPTDTTQIYTTEKPSTTEPLLHNTIHLDYVGIRPSSEYMPLYTIDGFYYPMDKRDGQPEIYGSVSYDVYRILKETSSDKIALWTRSTDYVIQTGFTEGTDSISGITFGPAPYYYSSIANKTNIQNIQTLNKNGGPLNGGPLNGGLLIDHQSMSTLFINDKKSVQLNETPDVNRELGLYIGTGPMTVYGDLLQLSDKSHKIYKLADEQKLDRLSQLPVYDYHMVSHQGEQKTGMMAQDIQSIYPSIVSNYKIQHNLGWILLFHRLKKIL